MPSPPPPSSNPPAIPRCSRPLQRRRIRDRPRLRGPLCPINSRFQRSESPFSNRVARTRPSREIGSLRRARPQLRESHVPAGRQTVLPYACRITVSDRQWWRMRVGAIGKSRALEREAAGNLNVLSGECGPGLVFPLALVMHMAWRYPNANSTGAPLTATVHSATTSNVYIVTAGAGAFWATDFTSDGHVPKHIIHT